MEAGTAATPASGAAAASDDGVRLQRAVERLQALVVDAEEGKPVEAPALGEQLKRVKAAADRAIKGRADALRDPAVTRPLGKGLAHCLSRPQDEELCQGACNLVPTLARALTQHGSALALVLLPLLLDRLQDGQSTASAAYTGACALVSHCYDSEGAALPPVLARMMAADAAPAAPGLSMALPLDPQARRQLYQLLKIALEKWPVQSMRPHMPLVASCMAADVASPDPLRLEAGFKGLTYLGSKWQAEGEQIYRGMSRDKQQRFVQSHPGFRVPAAATPRTRRSPGAMRSPSPSRLTARTTPGRSASPTAALNGRRRLSSGRNPGAGTTPISSTDAAAAAGAGGSGQRRSKRSPAEQQQERVRQLLLYKMRRDRGFVDAALAAPIDFSLSASEDGSTTSSLRSEGRNSVRSDSGGGYRNSAARRQEELQRRKRLMMSPTLREGIQELRPSPMGLGGLGSLAGAGLAHVGVGVGMEGVGGLGSLAGVGLSAVGIEVAAPTPLQRFQQDLQAARSGSGESKRAREVEEEQEGAGQGQGREQPVSAGAAMAAEALCVQEEVDEEEEVESAPAVPAAVPEAKEEAVEQAGAGGKEVTPRTLARAMQQEALRIEMEANPTMVPPVLVPVAFEAEAAAMQAEPEEVNPPAPPVAPQDENAGNYLANTDASPAAAASVAASVTKPASRRGSGSGKRVSFSAEECVVIDAPPAALDASEEDEAQQHEQVQPEPLVLEVDEEEAVAVPYEPLEAEGEVPAEMEEDVGLGVVGEEEEDYDADMEEVGKERDDDVVLEDITEEEELVYEEVVEEVVEVRVIEETKWGEHEPVPSRSKDESGGSASLSFASSRRLFIATTVAVAGAVLVGTAVLRKYPQSAPSTAGLAGVREQMQQQHQQLAGAGWDDDLGSFSLDREMPMPSFSSDETAPVVKPQAPPKKQQPKQQVPKQEAAAAEAKMPTPSIFQKQEAVEQEKAAAAAPTSKEGGGRWPFLGVVKQAPATAAEPGTPVRPTSSSSSSSSAQEGADLQVLRVPRRSKFWGRVGEVVQRAISFRLFGVLLALGMVFLSLV